MRVQTPLLQLLLTWHIAPFGLPRAIALSGRTNDTVSRNVMPTIALMLMGNSSSPLLRRGILPLRHTSQDFAGTMAEKRGQRACVASLSFIFGSMRVGPACPSDPARDAPAS